MLDTRQAGRAMEEAGAREIAESAISRAKAAQASHIGRDAVKAPSVTDRLGKLWGMAGFLVMPAMLLGGGAKRLAGTKMLAGSEGAKNALTTFGKSTGLINSNAADFEQGVHDILGKNHAVSRAVTATSETLGRFAERTLGGTQLGKKALVTLKGNQVLNTVFTVGMVAQGIGGMVASKMDAARTLQQMHYDMTGEKISKMQALKGKVDPFVAAVRKSEVSSGKALGATALEGAGILGNMGMGLFMKDSGRSMGGNLSYMAKAAAIGMVPGMGSNILRSGNTALQGYNALYKSFAQNGKADVALYTAVIGGLNKNAPDKAINLLAQKAFEKQMSPKDLLHMLKETDLLKPPGTATAVQSVPGKFMKAENARRAAANNGNYALQA